MKKTRSGVALIVVLGVCAAVSLYGWVQTAAILGSVVLGFLIYMYVTRGL